jgi:nitroreductase
MMKNDIDFIWSGREMRRRYIKGEKNMLKDLLEKNRSYRGYDETRKVTEEELRELVAYTRLCPAAANVQPLKYFLAWEPEVVNKIQPLTRWAGALPQLHLPEEGKRPTGFIVICQDTRISENLTAYLRDVGITAQTMLLAAVEMGLGGCMIGSFQKEELKKALDLPEYLAPMLVLAVGAPDEKIVLEDACGTITYYRDENGVHHVPKRTMEELVISGK